MILKYGLEVTGKALQESLKRLTNQIYKLLPLREEDIEWKKPLETIIEELVGLYRLLGDRTVHMLPLLSKLEGLFSLANDTDFMLYRRIIFECLTLLGKVIQECQD